VANGGPGKGWERELPRALIRIWVGPSICAYRSGGRRDKGHAIDLPGNEK